MFSSHFPEERSLEFVVVYFRIIAPSLRKKIKSFVLSLYSLAHVDNLRTPP